VTGWLDPGALVPLAVVFAAVIGVLLGLVGGGGSILTLPLLMSVGGLGARQAVVTSLVVVGVGAAAAVVPHALRGDVRWRAGALFASAGVLGAALGGRLSGRLPEPVLLGGFGVMMVATAVALFRCRRCDGQPPAARPQTKRSGAARLLLLGMVVGAVTGLVGVGGGFVIVPALTLLAGLPTRAAVATSLFVIALNCLAGFTGQLAHARPDPALTWPLALACATGSLAGSLASDRLPQRLLRRGLALLVLIVGAAGAVAANGAAPRTLGARPGSHQAR
jgi:uncharacterized membrane protein YfcA